VVANPPHRSKATQDRATTSDYAFDPMAVTALTKNAAAPTASQLPSGYIDTAAAATTAAAAPAEIASFVTPDDNIGLKAGGNSEKHRLICLVGDGRCVIALFYHVDTILIDHFLYTTSHSFQMTAQEMSTIIRMAENDPNFEQLEIVILLFNNKGYTIEVEIHDGKVYYN